MNQSACAKQFNAVKIMSLHRHIILRHLEFRDRTYQFYLHFDFYVIILAFYVIIRIYHSMIFFFCDNNGLP